MSSGARQSTEEFGEAGFDSDPELDPGDLVESMDAESWHDTPERKVQGSPRRMIEDRQEARRLRTDLEDWDDWELDRLEH